MENTTDPKDGMLWIPPGRFLYRASHRSREGEFILQNEGPRLLNMAGFYIDQYEVTNAGYKQFLDNSGYQPADRHNFLKHWSAGFPEHLSNHPVTWVSLADAQAYAAWAGKRLPNDIEWQWAAQGADGRAWPWGDQFEREYCNSDSSGTSPVDTFPENTSPFGVCDMVGNVWEYTDQVLSDGWHRWCLIRGGSYYLPKGSPWYAEGGAQPVYHHHKFLMMAPSLDRCGTIGFRCVLSEGITVAEA